MPVYKFVEKPTAAELKAIISLYSAQGWWGPKDTPAGLRRLIKGSHCFLAVFEKGRALGIGRAISDRAGDAYIHDVTVSKEQRGRGLGAAIVKRLMARLKKDGIGWVALIAQDGSGAFYKKLGFRVLKRAHPMLARGTRV